MMNFSPNKGSGVEQPDMFAGDLPEKTESPAREYNPDSSIGRAGEDTYICPDCENTSQSCAHCHGRNYGVINKN
ncbi:MAG: hypothetical protein NTY66_00360 [Candidatus Vogelbacteria bacterium]|nr:hypothetical protein [Candidatus Vogelbacteria bacterium]